MQGRYAVCYRSRTASSVFRAPFERPKPRRPSRFPNVDVFVTRANARLVRRDKHNNAPVLRCTRGGNLDGLASVPLGPARPPNDAARLQFAKKLFKNSHSRGVVRHWRRRRSDGGRNQIPSHDFLKSFSCPLRASVFFFVPPTTPRVVRLLPFVKTFSPRRPSDAT